MDANSSEFATRREKRGKEGNENLSLRHDKFVFYTFHMAQRRVEYTLLGVVPGFSVVLCKGNWSRYRYRVGRVVHHHVGLRASDLRLRYMSERNPCNRATIGFASLTRQQ